MEMQQLTPELILAAYARGLFPMADHAEAKEIYWYDPELRGQLPIAALHIPKKLRKFLRKSPYHVTFDSAFSDVISGCAASASGREETWINNTIRDVFESLYWAGHAHSVEVWHNADLVGGLYGLSLGGAFFGESMFSTADNASKVALVYLAAHLHAQGFTILDTQFVNDHLKQFGVYEIPRQDYMEKLSKALALDTQFVPSRGGSSVFGAAVSFEPDMDVLETFLQSTTQTS